MGCTIAHSSNITSTDSPKSDASHGHLAVLYKYIMLIVSLCSRAALDAIIQARWNMSAIMLIIKTRCRCTTISRKVYWTLFSAIFPSWWVKWVLAKYLSQKPLTKKKLTSTQLRTGTFPQGSRTAVSRIDQSCDIMIGWCVEFARLLNTLDVNCGNNVIRYKYGDVCKSQLFFKC